MSSVQVNPEEHGLGSQNMPTGFTKTKWVWIIMSALIFTGMQTASNKIAWSAQVLFAVFHAVVVGLAKERSPGSKRRTWDHPWTCLHLPLLPPGMLYPREIFYPYLPQKTFQCLRSYPPLSLKVVETPSVCIKTHGKTQCIQSQGHISAAAGAQRRVQISVMQIQKRSEPVHFTQFLKILCSLWKIAVCALWKDWG